MKNLDCKWESPPNAKNMHVPDAPYQKPAMRGKGKATAACQGMADSGWKEGDEQLAATVQYVAPTKASYGWSSDGRGIHAAALAVFATAAPTSAADAVAKVTAEARATAISNAVTGAVSRRLGSCSHGHKP